MTSSAFVFVFLLHFLGSALSTPTNIRDTLIADSRFTSLVSALTANNLADVFTTSGPFTVFAPVNSVFPNLAGVPLAAQANILTYHVLGLNITASLSGRSNTFTTLQGTQVQVSVVAGPTVYVNNRNGTEAIPCTNGVIHVLSDGVLTPSTSTVTTAAIATPALSTLVTLLGVAGYVNLFNSTGNNTVFAPTNTAFSNLEAAVPGLTAYLLRNPATLQTVLQYHVLPNIARTSYALVDQLPRTAGSNFSIPTLAGSNLFFYNDAGLRVGANARVTTADVFVTNGIVHIIDSVLVPTGFVIPPTILQALQRDSRFSLLVSALAANGLADLFNGSSSVQYTVFAPVNTVFPNLNGTTSQTQTAVLTYHVLAFDLTGQLAPSDPISYNTFITVQGTQVQVTVVNRNVYVNNRNGTESIPCLNGVIHVLNDGALSIPSDLVSTATTAGLTTLLTLVNVSGLSGLVSSGNLTVFAPTNQAFSDLEAAVPGVTAFLLDNVATHLIPILAYHVIGAPRIAAAIVASTGPLLTLNGELLPVNRGNGLTFGTNAASVVVPNVFVTNGLVHVINKVLLPANVTIPPSILEAVVADSRFTELAAALVANGLADMFNGSSTTRYTVFAPIDSVFPNNLTGVNQTQLLTYHVLVEDITGTLAPGNISYNTFTTAQGSPVQVTVVEGAVYINDVRGDEAIVCRNGVIHVLSNGYLTVPSDLVTTATAANLTTLLTLVGAAGLSGALTTTDVTVFAPTNDAFVALESAVPCVTAYLLGNATALVEVLTYHVVAGPRIAAALFAQPEDFVDTLGGVLPIFRGATLSLGTSTGPEVIVPNVFVTNGVVHVIDGVLVPPTLWLPANLCSATTGANGGSGTSGTATGTGSATATGSGTGTGTGSGTGTGPSPTGTGTGPSPTGTPSSSDSTSSSAVDGASDSASVFSLF